MITVGALTNCGKQNLVDPIRYEVTQDPAGVTENFKMNNPAKYTIQFPSSFQGCLTIGFEGNFFNKNNPVDSTYLIYNNCSPTYCYDFGTTLINTTQTSVLGVFNYGQDTFLLTQRIEFTRDNELVGIFYHNDEAGSRGKLFWKDGGIFKDALDAGYKKGKLSQVIEIIRTIREI
jgi:hypothetical protein